jgi:hypothetical protein
MWTDDYVGEKLRALDTELARRAPHRASLDARFARRTPVRPRLSPGPVLGGPVRMTGGVLHWIGLRLQSWGAPATVEGAAALVAATPGTPWWKEGC